MLSAIDRSLADAEVLAISDETRFDAAYKAIMQCALTAMLSAGYRPVTNEPGHHLTLIQSLPLTLGIANDAWIVLDALRKQRNASDYTGQPVSPGAVQECITQAMGLRERLVERLSALHPALLPRRQ